MRKTHNIKNTTGGLLLLLFIFGLFFSVATAVDETSKKDKKGLITYKDGRVRKKEITGEEWKQADVNSSVLTGDRVRTYKRSRAELELLELDMIRMAPETIIDVVKLYEETKTQQKETKIALQKGDIWAKIKKKDKSTKFDISAPVAVAAITGTVLRMGVSADSSTELKVYNGEVQITNAPEKSNITPKTIEPYEIPGPYEIEGPHEVSMEEWVYIVRNMQKIVFDKKGKITHVGDFNANDKDEQSDWVKWNLQRDGLGK
ncbi:FecR domain-containing protein [candidate division KSB1 bacterium]|nr:FecR domain-containing protein [candidate division KSB1 bacterium]